MGNGQAGNGNIGLCHNPSPGKAKAEDLDRIGQKLIHDSYDLPTAGQTEKMRKLTGIDWDAEELQMSCCEYWSHNS